MYEVLELIAKQCDTCQLYTLTIVRFKVTFPTKDLVFGYYLSLALIVLDKKEVLHIVRTATRVFPSTYLY